MTPMELSFAAGTLAAGAAFFVCAIGAEAPKTNGSNSSNDSERNIESSGFVGIAVAGCRCRFRDRAGPAGAQI
jgi:hypothetical protein